jgi:hypothetical protein
MDKPHKRLDVWKMAMELATVVLLSALQAISPKEQQGRERQSFETF